MPDNVKQNTNEKDVHIYIDDPTGDMYMFDGTQLVKIGNTTPQIGDKGDKDFQDREEQERQAQIEKEKEEEGSDGEDSGDADSYEETEEEKQQRLDDIRNMLGDDSIGDEIQSETQAHIDKELRKKKAAEKKEAEKYSSSIQKFRQSLKRFIANQVQEIRDRTFKREDPSYEGSGIIRPGKMIDDNTKIPKINVYFDQSGSWDDSDIKVGEEAIGILNNYVERGEIEIDIYFFSNRIYSTASAARNDGGTAAGAELINHIVSTKPDNVIVMTDDDFDSWGEINDAPFIKVPGAVWLLFRNGRRSTLLQQHLKGRRQTRVFDFSTI